MQVAITYRVTRDLDEDDASTFDMCLSSEERARRAEFVFPFDRRDFGAAQPGDVDVRTQPVGEAAA